MNQFFKLTFTLALCVACISAQAKDRNGKRQEWRNNNPELFSINFSIGAFSSYGYGTYIKDLSYWNLVSQLYSDYRGAIKTTGIIGGEFNWNISRWFNASGYLGVCPTWNDTYDGITGAKNGQKSNVSIDITPKVKVMWCNNPLVRVYTSVSLGISWSPGFRGDDTTLYPAFQLNPVGLEVGRKWFGLMELGFGTAFLGGRIGFGYKF